MESRDGRACDADLSGSAERGLLPLHSLIVSHSGTFAVNLFV